MGRVYQHELGRRHCQNMSATYGRKRIDDDNTNDQRSVINDSVTRVDVAPGEPVPPGFEGEINRKAQIQERLDGFKVGPLVALEYLIELVDYDASREPSYLCILCDKKGDPRTVLTHLASYNHISQYLQKHFPSCYRALAPYMTKQYKRNWQIVLQKIAEATEKKFGRLRPFCIEQDKFEKDRMHYLTMISKGMHFSEQNGPNFVELVVHEELTKIYDDDGRIVKSNTTNFGGKVFIEKQPVKQHTKKSPSPPIVPRPTVTKKPRNETIHTIRSPAVENKSRRRSLSSISSISSDDGQPKRGRRLARNRSPPSRERDFDGGRDFVKRKAIYNRRSPSPKRRFTREEEEERRKNREKDRLQKIEEYNKLSKAIENDIEKTLKQYEKNPEKHPKYNDEWKLFWNRRYKELQLEGRDVSKYDFKPEWIQFWGKRMKELSKDELKIRKDGLRKRLGLGDEPAPISFRINAPSNKLRLKEQNNKPKVPITSRPDDDPEVIILDDKSPGKKSILSRDKERSHSPWESDTSPPRSMAKSRKSRSPSLNRRRSRDSFKSRDRSLERRRSLDRSRRSLDKSRRSPAMSRNSRDKKSRSPDSYTSSSYHSREYIRERDLRDHDIDSKPKERSRERGLRESSFERDIRGKDRVRTVAELPWERDKIMYPHSSSRLSHDDYYTPPSMLRAPLNYLPPPVLDEEPDDVEVNIVSVLRLLTALEERLGSLGPKIIDLLAQALALEKKDANSSETLLDNEINCVMFETVKEKLKGQLLAGLVDPLQERAFKKAIKRTASLIHIAGERKKSKTTPEQAAVAVPGVGAVDKAAIAKQLANALIAQGKTDVSQNELEQLINAVVGMAEASKASNKPVTAASFLAQLTGGETSTGKPQNEQKEKIIIPRIGRHVEEKKDPISSLEGLTEPLSPSTPERSATNNMENLSDSDLQTLLQNFKDLSTEEQMNLINYLKKLELDEPERVERLRKFVNLGSDKIASKEVIDLDKESSPDRNRRKSPFSNRLDELNPESGDNHKDTVVKIHLDSEDEDYSYEDVVKAASKNVKQKEMEDNRKIVEDSLVFSSANQKDSSLSDAKTIISNLMGSLGNRIATSNVNLLGLPVTSTTVSNSNNMPPSSYIAKALSGINVDNLASIVSNAQKVTTTDTRLNFQSNDNNFAERYPPQQNSDSRQFIGNPRGIATPNLVRSTALTQSTGHTTFGQTTNTMTGNPRGNYAPIRYQPRPSLVQNQFGNAIFQNQRPQLNAHQQFNPNFNNTRFGGPRQSGFNNRW
ncbi:hypothetical protein ABEB36_014107 [Hypothenemus hampei]